MYTSLSEYLKCARPNKYENLMTLKYSANESMEGLSVSTAFP